MKTLPAKPGVYLFRDAEGDVLYIGKAKSLRPRVRSYFQAAADTRSTMTQLPGRVADVEVIVTDTEVEALHLEQNLVKRHRPPFNVRLRDDKSFPYIAVTVEDEYPRVMFTSSATGGASSTSGRTRTRRRCARRSTSSTESSPTGPARGRSQVGTRAFRASITTSNAVWLRASGTCPRTTTETWSTA